ncbi:TPA: thioredoxin, partial [Streptococcus suis]|nr:thioredoxin [Streptococcus suis]HEM6322000.1 thioredoxin [Streptococcus suis]
MANRVDWARIIVPITIVGIIFFTVLGLQTIWTEYVTKDYDKHLTEQVYVDAVVNQNA